MSSLEFKTDNAFFTDPVLGRVNSYEQFAQALACPSTCHGEPSDYFTICSIVSKLIRGHDLCIDSNKISPCAMSSETEACATNNWRQALRNSKSRIFLVTSGTTGVPKQVEHSVQSLTRGVRIGEHHRQDVWGLAYPLDHLAGLQVVFQALLNQNTIVQLFGLPSEAIHEAIENYGVTHLSCTPTYLKLLASGERTHQKVRRLTTGGERCDSASLATIKKVFPAAKHRNIYALTEVGNLLVGEGEQFTVPIELKECVAVIDGNLAIHRSLLADPSVRDSRDDGDDWFLTGDLVDVLNEDPLTIKFTARHDDVINVGGNNVIPQQVEEHLVAIPEIRQAVAYGKQNSVTGQIVVCDVILEPDQQLDMVDARRQLAKVLPRYAIPRMINIVESLRMTPSGKLCRRSETS